MTLNVPEAEERARAVRMSLGSNGVARCAEDVLALAALARELAVALSHYESDSRPDRPVAKARAAGLLPARESAPAEPSKSAKEEA